VSITEVTPGNESRALLAGAQFADAYRIEVEGAALDAGTAALLIMGRSPRWVRALLSLRNVLVTPFGLKTSGEPRATGIIGLFPVVSATPQRLVAGFDDRHLDFRIIVDVAPAGDTRQQVTSTTLVRTHNLLGRVYLALVMPFHRVIARAMLRQVAHG
jgi:Protein of unknown function (DUF2867)